jgi:hypothetical protein
MGKKENISLLYFSIVTHSLYYEIVTNSEFNVLEVMILKVITNQQPTLVFHTERRCVDSARAVTNRLNDETLCRDLLKAGMRNKYHIAEKIFAIAESIFLS